MEYTDKKALEWLIAIQQTNPAVGSQIKSAVKVINNHKNLNIQKTGNSIRQVGGRPLFNQQVNKKAFKDGRYINWNVWSDETLIQTLEKLLVEKKDVSWDLWPEDNMLYEIASHDPIFASCFTA